MNLGRTVFSQLVESLPTYEFQICVDRYQGHRYVKDFSCWDQFLSLAFAQLTYRESLRDIEACLRAQQPKLYHMGFRGQVFRFHNGQTIYRQNYGAICGEVSTFNGELWVAVVRLASSESVSGNIAHVKLGPNCSSVGRSGFSDPSWVFRRGSKETKSPCRRPKSYARA